MKGLSGTVRNHIGFILLAALMAAAAFIVPGLALSATVQENVQPPMVASTLRTLNISVTNTNSTNNISRVVISLPATYTFVEGSNATSALNTNFTNQTNSASPFSGKIQNLSWNATAGTAQGIIGASQTAYFLFKVYLPSSAETSNLTVHTYSNETSPSLNATNLTLVVTGLSSTSGNFSAHRTEALFNWTNTTLTIEMNINGTFNGTQLLVDTLQTNISGVYFTKSDYVQDVYAGLTLANREKCFAISDSFDLEFIAENTSLGAPGFLNRTIPLNATNVTSFTININTPFCPPGLYRGMFAVRNLSNPSTDRIHIPATVHIPVSRNNTLTEANNTAYVKGTNTSQTVQSFYFFTNLTANITAVTVNLSLSQDADLFLLDPSGSLLEKSIGSGSASEEVFRFFTSAIEAWEVRLVNIMASFTGFLYFSTLNITNTTMTNVSIRNITFGAAALDPNETNTTAYRLVNADLRTIKDVQQSIEVYQTQTFLNYNATQTFEIFVPNYTTKLKVAVQWNNQSSVVTDWDLFLGDNAGRAIANSTNKSAIANSTNLVREEVVEYAGPFNTSLGGLWNITVTNQTNDSAKNFYNVTTFVFLNQSLWVNTSFNQSTTFNVALSANASFNVTATVTVPRNEILNGTYRGTITYHNNSGWKVQLPLFFQVEAGHLFINKNLSATTVERTSNVGNNRTITLNISINNTGGTNIFFDTNTSQNALFLTTNTQKWVNFTIQNPPSVPLLRGNNTAFNITITVDSRNISHTPGIYRGWIFVNTANASNVSSSSYPYSTFNVTLDLNLTDTLNATIDRILTGHTNTIRVENTNTRTNITLEALVRTANESLVSISGVMTLGDFHSPSIVEQNTSTSYTLTNLTDADGSAPLCDTDTCNMNVTIPTDVVGGQYRILLQVRWNTSESNLTATAFNGSLTVNNTGINMSAPISVALGNVNEATGTAYVNVSAGNLGPLDAIQASFTLNVGPCPVTVSRETSGVFSSGCSSVSSSGSGATFSATVNGFTPSTAGCALRWKLTASNVSADTSCTLNVTANRASFNNITGITLTVKETGGGSSSSSSSTGSGSTTTTKSCTADSECTSTQTCSGGTCKDISCASHEYIENRACVAYAPNIASYQSNLSVLLGEATSMDVLVNESNNKTITVALNVSLDSSVSAAASPATCVTPCTFTVNFSTTNATPIRAFAGTLTASHSILTAASQSKAFTFTVLPTEAKKAEIKQQYETFLPLLTSLQQEFTALKPGLTEGNVTLLQALLDKMNSLSSEIASSLEAGDYVAASTFLADLNSTVSQLQAKFSELRAGGAGAGLNLLAIAIIAVIIVGIAGILAYLLLPPKGQQSKAKPFTPKGRGIRRLTTLFRRRKRKEPLKGAAYPEGYEHQQFTSQKRGRLNSLKKKQRKLKDFKK